MTRTEGFLTLQRQSGPLLAAMLRRDLVHEELFPGVPLRFSWNGKRGNLTARGTGNQEQIVFLKPGSKAVILGMGLRYETSESVRRFQRDPHDLSPAYAEELEFCDRYLPVCADRARLLAFYYQIQNKPLQAGIYFEKAIHAPDTNPTHFLAALSAFAQLGEHAWVERLLHLVRSRFPGSAAIKQWEYTYRDRQRRYRHLSALYQQSLLSTLNPSDIHHLTFPPFTLAYPADTANSLVHLCKNALLRAKQQLRDYAPFPEAVPVRLDTWNTPHHPHARGFFNGDTIFINRDFFQDNDASEQLQATVKHELIHFLNASLTKALDHEPPPRWLDEGLAYYLTEASFEKAVPGEFETLDAINEALSKPTAVNHEKACRCAAAFVAHLLTAKDEHNIIAAARELLPRAQSEFEDAFAAFRLA
ncbi:hypothetical protein SCOR_16610 [Sulfidibacter corallicola]|uniref:Uncharacterized protein n=1 Tax=Sulfidibacter corallicola TaxID=2818388 RepID=A0A8A4TVD2_SULCO|nr:hypothetical protein [Sulfidibacter corallicola]QTD53916.1 hypothetical protein J3U87_15820 [Sulfidibacter corallicola]